MTIDERFPDFAKSVEKANYLITARENGQPINPEAFDKAVYSVATSYFNDPKVQKNLTDVQKKLFNEYYEDAIKYNNKKVTPSVSNIIDLNRAEKEAELGKVI